jgi:hypothetical protein
MQPFIQIGNFRICLFILPDNILAGLNIGYSIDENGVFHRSLNIGFIFVVLSFILFNEKTH